MTEIEMTVRGKRRVRWYCDECGQELFPKGSDWDKWVYRYEDEQLCPMCLLKNMDYDDTIERIRE